MVYTDISPPEKASRAIPATERQVTIEDVSATSQIDLVYLLGRSARGVLLKLYDAADEATFRLNSKRRLTRWQETQADTQDTYWSSSAPSLVSTGSWNSASEVPGLRIQSIEIASLNLAVGSRLDVIAW